MQYEFPPAPDGYIYIIVARLMLAVWSVMGVGIVIRRLRHWSSIQPMEIFGWLAGAVISGLIGVLGSCRYASYDNDLWLWPALSSAVGVSIAGITICLSKVYVEGTSAEKGLWFVVGAFSACIIAISFGAINPFSCSAEAARSSQCKGNLKQIGLALFNYHDTYRSFPAAVNASDQSSWRVAILPFLDNVAVYDKYNAKVAWDVTPNDVLTQVRMPIYECPSNYHPKDDKGRWFSAYAMLMGPGMFGQSCQGVSIGDITDGTSQTITALEACGAQIVWTEPRDIDCQTRPPGINLSGPAPGQSAGWASSYHRGSLWALMVDGAVRNVSAKTDPEVLRKLATINGQDDIDRSNSTPPLAVPSKVLH